MQTSFRNALVIAALGVGIAPTAHAQDAYVARWQSVIGIIQASNVVGTGTGAVTGAPGPWSAQGGTSSLIWLVERSSSRFAVSCSRVETASAIPAPSTR